MKPRFPSIRTHTFRDRKFKIKWRRPKRTKDTPKSHEECGRYDPNTMTLTIYPDSDPYDLLDTVLDETSHACYPDLDDECVRDGVTDTMALLKRMGMEIKFNGRKL